MKTIQGLFILFTLTLLAGWSWKGNTAINNNEMKKNEHSIQIIAHRGGAKLAPENTLAAFRQAIDLGVDMIEIDVHLSKDGHIMVIHDFTLDRTTTGKGRIVDLTLDEIKKYDAGIKFSDTFRGEKVPTLEETMDLLKGKTALLIEIKKNKDEQYPGIEEKIVETIHKYHATDWVVVQSFNRYSILQTKKTDPAITTFYLTGGNFDALYSGISEKLKTGEKIVKAFDGVAPNYSRLSGEKVKTLQKAGFKVYTWTVDKPADMKKIAGWQIDGIITNAPDKLIEILKK